MGIKYYVRTTGERVLDDSFSQIQYEYLIDSEHKKGEILAEQLFGIDGDNVVLIEDDVILCKNFDQRIRRVIEDHPDDIINFFTHPRTWFESQYTTTLIYNQCTYIPQKLIAPLAAQIEQVYQDLKYQWKTTLTAEPLMQRAIKRLGLRVYLPRPCLVQHIDDGSLLEHYRAGRRRTPYFIDYFDQLGIDNAGARDPENRKKLEELLSNQFQDIDKNSDYAQLALEKKMKMQKSKKSTVLIVGYGVVGHNLHKELSVLECDIYDKFKTEFNTKKPNTTYDYCFICVDTPYSKTNPCDISQVENAILENDARIYVIKSTILPGTTCDLAEKYGKHIIFSPEYYGGTQHCNNFAFNFTILGGAKEDCIQVQQLLQNVYDATHVFRLVDSKTAELAKYMENCFLGTKVSFCNQFYYISQAYGVDYEDVRELFVLDPRVNGSHTFVYREHPYYDTHCLNKDIPAIAQAAPCDTHLLSSVIRFNENSKHGVVQNFK